MPAGVVKDTLEGGIAVVDVKNPFVPGESLSILPVNRKIDPYELAFSEIKDLSGHVQEKAITNRVVCCINSDGKKLKIGDMIRRVL